MKIMITERDPYYDYVSEPKEILPNDVIDNILKEGPKGSIEHLAFHIKILTSIISDIYTDKDTAISNLVNLANQHSSAYETYKLEPS